MKRTQKIAGGLVVGGIILGAFLAGKFPGFPGLSTAARSVEKNGTQPATGTQPAGATQPGTAAAPAPAGNSKVLVQSAVPGTTSNTAKPAAAPLKMLIVRIQGDKYLLSGPSRTKFTPATLGQVIEVALTTTGTEDGLRVRIERTGGARYTSWAVLIDELERAGIDTDAISMPKDLAN